MSKRKKTGTLPETQWTGRLITTACEHGFSDLIRIGDMGAYAEDEFNRICKDKAMRWECLDKSGKPGDLAVWFGAPNADIASLETMILPAAHYYGARAFFMVVPSTTAGLDWWTEQLEALFEIVDLEDNGDHIICLAKPLALVGEIKVIGAVKHEQRTHNMRLNSLYFRNRLAPRHFTGNTLPPHGQTAVLACAGPSLQSTWPQIKMDYAAGERFIVSCSMAYRFLMDRSIHPHAHIECDPRPHKVEQIAPIEVHNTEFWLASCVAPEWQDHIPESRASLWHSHSGPESVAAIHEIEPGAGLICGGGSVGLRSICLLYFRGFRHVIVHAMDCSFSDDGRQHAGQHLGKLMPEIEVRNGKRKFRTSPVMMAYARYFDKLVGLLPDMQIELAGDGLLQSMYGKR